MDLRKQINDKYELSKLQHMIDFENLESIFKAGKIHCKNMMTSHGINYTDISNESVQDGRSKIVISCTGKALHDYVPLYWGQKTPMVASLQSRNESLIFLMFSPNLLINHQCVITDGNARSLRTKFKVYQALTDLNMLDPKSIKTLKYAHDEEIKRRKQAELLVLDFLSLKNLLYIVCFSNVVKTKIEALMTTHGINYGVYIGAGNYYF